jgi:acetylglutamate synthase
MIYIGIRCMTEKQLWLDSLRVLCDKTFKGIVRSHVYLRSSIVFLAVISSYLVTFLSVFPPTILH